MAFSQPAEKGQVPVCCNLCEMEVKISWKCFDCDLLMCNRCKDRIHTKIKNAKNHKVVDIKEVGQHTEEVDFSNIKCKEHKNQVCVMFCKSCDQLVCTQCIAKIHNGHGLVEISEGYQIHIEMLKEGQNGMTADIDTLTNTEYKIKEMVKAENTKYLETRNNIQVNNTSLKKSVDQYTEKLLSHLDQKWESFKDATGKEECRVILLKQDRADKNNLVKDILNSNDVEKIFDENKELDKSMKDQMEPLNLDFTSMPTFVPGEISQYNVGSLQHTSADITLQVIKEYTTDISHVFYMSPCVDSLCISDQDVVQRVQPEENNLKVISSVDMKVYGIAVTPSNDLLIIPESGSVLKIINTRTGEIVDSNYSVDPLVATAVHVTSDYKVVVGGFTSEEESEVGTVIMMNKEGKHKTIYEYDRNNQSLFKCPLRITCTNNGNICVVDQLSSDDRGRVVVLAQGGDILNIYNGHPDINNEETPFKPLTIVTTPGDNIVVSNLDIDVLHILNNEGHLITHIYTQNNGIERPYSIAFTRTGKVYIGCSSFDKAKLYEVQLLGC